MEWESELLVFSEEELEEGEREEGRMFKEEEEEEGETGKEGKIVGGTKESAKDKKDSKSKSKGVTFSRRVLMSLRLMGAWYSNRTKGWHS